MLTQVRYCLTALLAVFSAVCATAQQPFFRDLSLNIRNNNVRLSLIAEDHEGILWVSSETGLYRFNGSTSSFIDFSAFKLEKITALSTTEKYVLAGTRNGQLAVFNRKTLQPEYQLQVASVPVSVIVPTSGQNFLLGTEGEGIFIVRNGKIMTTLNTSNGLPDQSVHDIEIKHGEIFVATDGGLVLLSPECQLQSVLTAQDGLSDNLIYDLHFFHEHLILGMQNGSLSSYHPETGDISVCTVPSSSSIRKITSGNEQMFVFDQSGNLFIANQRFDNLYTSFYSSPIFTAEHPFGDALVDQEGNLLLSTHANTLRLADTRFSHISLHENVSFADVSAIHCDENQRLWLATKSGLCYHNILFGPENKLRFFTSGPTRPEKKSSASRIPMKTPSGLECTEEVWEF